MKVLRDVLVPMIEVDGGVMYLVSLDESEVALHLAGTCAGCPGTVLTTNEVIKPAVHGVAPKAKVTITSGWTIPKGAKRLLAEKKS